MSMEVTIEDLATPTLHEMSSRLRDRTDLHERMGAGAAKLIKEHFLAKNKEPNKKNWRKTGFFGREGFKKTRLESFDTTGATVTVASPAMKMRHDGGTIQGKPWLGRPLREENYGKSAGEFIERRGGLKGTGLFFRRSGSGRLFLMERQSGGPLRLHYIFYRRVKIPADPSVLPTEKELRDTVSHSASIYLDEITK